MESRQGALLDWVERRAEALSDWNRTIFDYGETAWREYRSAAWYVERLRAEGFTVEAGSGGMPTAFCALWDNGPGPTIGGYAEYDGIPGNCQAADTVQRPRDGLSPFAGGHTDPHSALGIGALGGFLAAKAAMEAEGIGGRLKFFGEPAEKVRGSKPIHAARGYYDDLDAAISFHPFFMLPLCNTVRWDTHCGVGYGLIYSFTCPSPETWLGAARHSPIPAAHADARAPGANDAVVQMYLSGKSLKEHLVSNGVGWSMNEVILNAGQATADNIPAQLAQIMYFLRLPTVELAERVVAGLDHFAESAARLAHCEMRRDWVAKSRPGLPNHALARATFRNLEIAGPPRFEGEAIRLAQEIQRAIGHAPSDAPYIDEIERLVDPEESERQLRALLPPWQKNFTSDDYTEFCWHAPTVRLYIGRPALKAQEGAAPVPSWAMNALAGLPPCIDPTVLCAAKTIGLTILDLLTDSRLLEDAKSEFESRTGGGKGGTAWLPPLCDYAPPIDFRWPEYVTTPRGERDWVIPPMAGIWP